MSSEGDAQGMASTFAKEEVRERVAEGELDFHPDSVVLPEPHAWLERHLRRALDNPEDSVLLEYVHNDGMEKALRRAIRQNDVSILSYFRGWKGDEVDVSGIKSLTQLFKVITSPGGRILYVFGNQGAGKTDFVVLVGEMLHEFHGVEIHTNIESLADNHDHVQYFDTDEGLKEAIRKDERTFIILDEASRLLRGENHHEVIQTFQGDLHSLRKSDSNIVLIGHSGKDIDPLFRALATFVHKESQKRVKLYEGADVTTEGQVNGYGELLSLSGIPPTNYDFDTDEESTFSIEDDEPDMVPREEVDKLLDEEMRSTIREVRDTRIRLLAETEDLTQGEIADRLEETAAETELDVIADVYSISQGQISNILA